MTNIPDPQAAIEITGLRKLYRGMSAVDDITFTVRRGRIAGLLGPNGAGKTTTMRALLGLARIDFGSAFIDGRPYSELPAPARTVGAVLDAGGLHPGRTGRQHLRVAAQMAGVATSRADAMLTELGLEAASDRRIASYSLGMRQRIALAAALLGEPSILVLDEPANGLDPAGTRWLRDSLRAFAARGGTALVSSHVLGEVAHIADDIVLVDRGRVIADGEIDALTERFGGDLERFYLELTSDSMEVR